MSESACAFLTQEAQPMTQVTHVQKEKDDPKRWAVFFVYKVFARKRQLLPQGKMEWAVILVFEKSLTKAPPPEKKSGKALFLAISYQRPKNFIGFGWH